MLRKRNKGDQWLYALITAFGLEHYLFLIHKYGGLVFPEHVIPAVTVVLLIPIAQLVGTVSTTRIEPIIRFSLWFQYTRLLIELCTNTEGLFLMNEPVHITLEVIYFILLSVCVINDSGPSFHKTSINSFRLSKSALYGIALGFLPTLILFHPLNLTENCLKTTFYILIAASITYRVDTAEQSVSGFHFRQRIRGLTLFLLPWIIIIVPSLIEWTSHMYEDRFQVVPRFSRFTLLDLAMDHYLYIPLLLTIAFVYFAKDRFLLKRNDMWIYSWLVIGYLVQFNVLVSQVLKSLILLIR